MEEIVPDTLFDSTMSRFWNMSHPPLTKSPFIFIERTSMPDTRVTTRSHCMDNKEMALTLPD